ncbi:MAG: cytochrome P450 [Acidobacteriaceae bacterium]
MTYRTESASGMLELLRFRRDPIAYVGDIGKRGVDIRHIRAGSRHIFMVNHPELIRDILITHDWNFVKGPGLRSSKAVLGNGLLTSEGELHRRQRRLVQPAFHSARLATYAEIMVQCAATHRGTWKSGIEYFVDEQMMRLTLQIVGRTLFSADMQDEAAEVSKSLKNALRVFVTLNNPLAQLLPPVRSWARRKATQSRREIETLLNKVVDAHRQHPETYDDMLSMLLRSHDDSSAGYMSNELLLDECLTLFLAGHETTANALVWTWYLLSQHPEIEAALEAELDAVLAGRLPTLEDVPALKYTGQVLREAMRLYPPAWIIARDAVTAYRLGDLDAPQGSTLMMSPYATHHDPRFWPNPDVFYPERWAGEGTSARSSFSYYPFGAGTRVCIGEHFAMMEGVLLIATLAQQWRFTLVPGQQIVPFPRITLRPRRPMAFTLSRRDVRSAT